ncbi:hypothetical protein [Pasteurella multocida]|nr:hypothetical protein [Pasteurella multocida]MDC4235781.1 hypothetical protein [Pasteurella multocida]OIQ13331.1 hypothetical protein UR07_10670 [Pasteurella multocida subsp. multocida]PNW19760.1 hypothetical protein AP056_11125 [Pasteurella multocida subsp. multocida]HEH9651813.1 hypothetical protein [Pasteurella multocida]HEH9676942.1 hypothetical protein [Pasteurella multocida]
MQQTITNEQLFAKLTALESLLAKQRTHINENSRELWSVSDIAKYFDYSDRHVRGAIICDPKFPKPVRVPSQRDINKPTTDARWFAGEVVKYAERRKV